MQDAGTPRVDIFCTVIDNFGDIGVSWRLARQLVSEYRLAVRLWVDDLYSFAKLCPTLSTEQPVQWIADVEVRHWSTPWALEIEAADLVIEAFGCSLPDAYIEAMKQRTQPALWVNLEYLTAETWAIHCHALPSLHASGLQKFFFFPGFQAQTGGLLREQNLFAHCRVFQADQEQQRLFLQSLGAVWLPDATRISLFSYENTAIADWLTALSRSEQPTHLLVPVGRVLPDVAAALGCESLQAGEQLQRGCLTLSVLPFMSMDQYDHLLWCCDLNFVRGEDSFVRAQWAGRPFVWHIYPQEEGAHWPKLEAFLAAYSQPLSTLGQNVLRECWNAWNGDPKAHFAWSELLKLLPELRVQADLWRHEQEAYPDLAGKLVSFYSDWL